MRSENLKPSVLNNPNRRWPGHYEEWLCRDVAHIRVKDNAQPHSWWGPGYYMCVGGSPKTNAGMEPAMEGDPSEFDVLTYIRFYVSFSYAPPQQT